MPVVWCWCHVFVVWVPVCVAQALPARLCALFLRAFGLLRHAVAAGYMCNISTHIGPPVCWHVVTTGGGSNCHQLHCSCWAGSSESMLLPIGLIAGLALVVLKGLASGSDATARPYWYNQTCASVTASHLHYYNSLSPCQPLVTVNPQTFGHCTGGVWILWSICCI
jgi:hypothetical protein